MSIISIIHLCFTIYTMMLVIQILSSWFRELDQFLLIQWIHTMTEPYLALFRQIIPPIGMLDISPILAFFFLQILETCVLRILLA